MATTPRKDLPGTNAPNWSQRVTEELRVLMGRGGNGRALTAKDLIDSGIAKPGAGGGLVPGVPGGGDTEPDLTPPPVPTGFAVTAGLTTVFVEHDAPGYTQGHGHDRTVVYGVLQTGSTAPTFDQAVVLFQFQGTIGAYPAALGTRYRLWIKWQSQDGVQSVSPAGGINGLDVQTGKIGNNDLGPLIVEAGNLANGSVSASKLAAQAVDATKFANGIEPVSVSTAATLPTVKSTSTIVWQGKLYRWDGTTYTAAVPTTDITGQINAAQLADNAVTVAKIAAGAVDAGKIAAGAVGETHIANLAITAAKVADNAVTVSKIADGAVQAGKIAASAVTADKIAAQAVDATKFASGIEPVGIVSGATLPTIKTTSTIVWQGKLYRWNGTAYTAAVPTTDLTGQINSGQLADNAVTVAKIAAGAVDAGKLASNAVTADKIAASAVDATKFASGIEPVGIVSGGSLPTVKTTATIVFGGKLYRWDGAKYTAATAATDVTGQLTDAQLAAISAAKLTGQITGTQITDGAISTPKIAAGAVSASQIAAGAVVADKLAANAVTAAAVAAGAITTAKLAANAVTANELAANAVTAGKIAAGAVSADQIAAGAITASKLLVANTANIYPDFDCVDINFYTAVAGAFSLTGSGVAANGRNIVNIAPSAAYSEVVSGWFSIESLADYSIKSRISLESVDAATLAEQYIEFATYSGANISNPTITRRALIGASSSNSATPFVAQVTAAGSERLARMVFTRAAGGTARGYIGAPNMVRMASGNLIVDGAITAIKIAAKAITAAQIAAGTITTTELGANSVTTAQIAAGSVTANEIATNAITAVKLAAGAVTAGKIAANAVTANEIAANAITTAKIAAGAVSATEIAAKAITAAKLAITDTSAVNIDPMFEDASFWLQGTASVKTIADGVVGPNVWADTVASSRLRNENRFTLDTSKTYLFEVWYRKLAATTGRDFAIARFFDAAGAVITTAGTGWPGTNAPSGNHYWPSVSNVVPPNVWTRYTLTVGPDGAAKFPPGVVACALGSYFNYSGSGTAEVQINMLRITEMARAELVVDGSITADKIAAKTITAAQIAASAITATELAANSVTTAKIAANAVTATQIAAGTITAAEIASGAITTAKIAANAITAAQIAASTITAAELGAGSVTTAKVAAGAITATEIATNAITAVKIAAGAVTAGKIAANAVSANEIAANAITAAKIAVGAVGADQIAANAITVKHLTVMDYSNIVLDPFIADNSSWATFTGTMVTRATAGVPANMPGPSGVQLSKSAAQSVLSRNFQTSPGEVYYMSAYVASATTTGLSIRLMLQLIDGTGTEGGNNGTHVGWGAAVTTTAASVTANTWTKIEGLVTVPAGAVFGKARIVTETGTAATGNWFATNFVCRRAASAELIVDGAIIAAKLSANAIAVGTAAIQDGAIVNAMIGNLAADKITAGTLAAARIAAGSIDATKLAALAVTAGKIAANAVTATEIAAGAITAAKLSAGAVTADKISVATLSAMAANLGTVTAGRIQNAANTTFIDLNATGATQAIKFGNDLSYSESGGLVINRLSVIGTNQLAPNSVSEQNYFAMPGEVELFQNDNFTQYWQVILPPGQTSLIVNSGSYQLNSWSSQLVGYKLEILVRAWGAGSNYKDLGYLVLDERPADGSNAPPPSWFTFPLGMVNSDVYPNVIFYYRSIGKALVTSMTRKINSMNMEILSIKR